MTYMIEHKWLVSLAVLIAVVLLIFIYQVLVIMFNGRHVPVPDIPRETVTLGSGPELKYVVIGDSSAVGVGVEYKEGIVMKSAEYLAKKHTVKLTNFAISGERVGGVLSRQVDKAAKLKPDVVLVAVGANDVTAFTGLDDIKRDATEIIDRLQTARPDSKIIMTGAADVGTASRFPQPTKFIAAQRVKQVNVVFDRIAKQNQVTRIKIAEITGPIFLKNSKLFASDNFHPNKEGYKVWTKVVIDGLKQVGY